MRRIKKYIAWCKEVNSGQRIPKNTFGYDLQTITRRTYIWFNSEDFRAASQFTKVIPVLLLIALMLEANLVIANTLQQPITSNNLSEVFDHGSLFVGSTIIFVKFIESWRHRVGLTRMLKEINDKVKEARRKATKEQLRTNLKVQALFCVGTVVALVIIQILTFLMVVYAIVTEQPYLKWALPLKRRPFGVLWWSEVLIGNMVLTIGNLQYTFLDGQMMDSICNLAFLFRVQYERLTILSANDEDTNIKEIFADICGELLDLNR